MADQDLIRSRLARHIERVADKVADGKIDPIWGGNQLVSLVRHWSYSGHDWHTPDEFSEFDLVMMDLECFPDGKMTSPENIVEAAKKVLQVARSL